jgi:predicted KAP-like P-loop ATPase
MFDADRPILNSAQDRLGRNDFAKYLARCMLGHTSPESLVIGLQGGWGSGKTSVINLTLEEIRYASNNMLDEQKPIVLNFSPWSYSGQNQLIYGFYRRLSSELRQAEYLENSADIIHLLELYASFFTHTPVPKPLRVKNRLLNKFKKVKKPKHETFAWESGLDPIQVKTQLNNLLKTIQHKIIIIIDNISRLEAKEINQILQIVKSMGDYANTIYLLSFDKTQVISAIDQIHKNEGEKYLEKLIQLPFDVPTISKQDLESLLLDRLQQLLVYVPHGSWNNTYWGDIFYSSLKHFFHSARDITHYVNTLSFSYEHVRDVVNPVDFFAITALEVFAQPVFYGIRENKDLFTDLLDNVYELNKDKIAQDRLRCDEILGRSKNIPRDILLTLLMQLFPRLHMLYHPEETYYHSEIIARNHYRICSPDIFDVYFRAAIPTSFMPESELDTLLSFSNDAESFDQALTRLNQDIRMTRFLDLLDGNALLKIPQENIPNVVNALIDNADLFPEGGNNPLSFNTAMRVHRICHQLLRSYSKTTERYDILRTSINKASKSLYIIVHELNAQTQQHEENADTFLPLEHRDITPDQLGKLCQEAVKKIEYWANNGRLAEHPKMLPILRAWKNWGSDADCESFLEKTIQDDKGLLAFLGAALQVPVEQAITKLEKNSSWKEYLENISDFIPIAKIEPRAKEIFEGDAFETLREKEQLAVLIFLDLIDAKTIKVIPKTTV